jgi:enoyl-CoA hydratase
VTGVARSPLAARSDWQYHTLGGQLAPGGSEFGRIMREKGLRAALEWRDVPFRAEGFEP